MLYQSEKHKTQDHRTENSGSSHTLILLNRA